LLLRHAKSAWDDPTLADRDRPLAGRGVRAAATMAPHVGLVDAVLCSPARRAKETLQHLRTAGAVGPAAEVIVDDTLYGATASDLLERIRRVRADRATLLVVGHNPGLEDLALGLARRSSDRKLVRALETKFPTAALAVLEADAWPDLTWRSATLVDFVTPKSLGPQ
jgi:phosphohistidine phosphatase